MFTLYYLSWFWVIYLSSPAWTSVFLYMYKWKGDIFLTLRWRRWIAHVWSCSDCDVFKHALQGSMNNERIPYLRMSLGFKGRCFVVFNHASVTGIILVWFLDEEMELVDMETQFRFELSQQQWWEPSVPPGRSQSRSRQDDEHWRISEKRQSVEFTRETWIRPSSSH